MATYAVNVADMTYPEVAFAAGLLLAPVTPSRRVVDGAGDRFDNAALVLECGEERARAIVSVLRLKRPSLRAYVSASGVNGWRSYKG